MLPKSNAWHRRSHFPDASLTSLSFPGELWVSDPEQYQGAAELQARYLALGCKKRPRELAYELAGFLLDDVLVAAGGVETSMHRLRDAIDRTAAWAAEHDLRATPDVPMGISHDTVIDAWYAFADLLSWVRTLDERFDRKGYKSKGRQGLFPAIKPKRLKKRITVLLGEFRNGPAGGPTRLLTNFSLHAALVRHPMSGASIDVDGKISLPMPDPPSAAVDHWYLLTWKDERDGIEFAEALWAEVCTLIDGVLAAFEKATPKRLRKAS
jgi:hypothetical protein